VNDLREIGYSQRLKRNYIIKFRLSGEGDYHTLTILSMETTRIRCSLRSEPTTFDLSVGEERSFDIAGDANPDVSVMLKSIAGEYAVITIRAILPISGVEPSVEVPSGATQLVEQPATPKECSPCPDCSSWSGCDKSVEKRTCYTCSEGTGYTCAANEEQRACVASEAVIQQSIPRFSDGIFYILLIAMSLTLIALSMIFYNRRKRGPGRQIPQTENTSAVNRPNASTDQKDRQESDLRPLVFDEKKE
jgi:hypothetical protein